MNPLLSLLENSNYDKSLTIAQLINQLKKSDEDYKQKCRSEFDEISSQILNKVFCIKFAKKHFVLVYVEQTNFGGKYGLSVDRTGFSGQKIVYYNTEIRWEKIESDEWETYHPNESCTEFSLDSFNQIKSNLLNNPFKSLTQ